MNANSACFSLLTQKSYLSRLMEIQRALMMSEFFKQHEVKTWLASYWSNHSCQSCYLNPVGPDQSQIVKLYISPMLFDYNRDLYWLLMWSKTAFVLPLWPFAFQSFSHFTNYLCFKITVFPTNRSAITMACKFSLAWLESSVWNVISCPYINSIVTAGSSFNKHLGVLVQGNKHVKHAEQATKCT